MKTKQEILKMSKKINKAERTWYGSKEHFNTEKSYEEHLEDLSKKKRINKEKHIV